VALLSRETKGWLQTVVAVLALLAALLPFSACRRTPGKSEAPNAPPSPSEASDVRCVERSEGCVWCEGRGVPPALVDPDGPPSVSCDPKDPGNCVDFCSQLTPECATPWHSGSGCLLPSEQEFRRELFRRDTADRPEVQMIGRALDEAGKPVEGARVRVWWQGAHVMDEVSGKDGGFRLKLRVGPWSYTFGISHAGLATEVAELKLDKPAAVNRSFRLEAENFIRGRVVDGAGAPVGGVTITALRSPEDQIEAVATQTGEDGNFILGGLKGRRYFLRGSKFGWLSATFKWAMPGPTNTPRVTIKLARTGVIKGTVFDSDGDGQPNATVVALLSAGGIASSPIIWSTDSQGDFAQDRFQPGTYYIWARHGETLAYPPEKIEITDANLRTELKLKLSHKGARVRGVVKGVSGRPLDPDARAVLLGRSPLALPRKAVGEIDHDGRFLVTGVLPGRYELSVRVGSRPVLITSGPREVEVPIDQGASIELSETVVVRQQAEE
jgi:hypothetical protein